MVRKIGNTVVSDWLDLNENRHADSRKKDETLAPVAGSETLESECLIRLKGVAKRYVGERQGPAALDSIDLEIPTSDFVAIMGPSGSGKTTLLSAIGGMNPVSEGKVLIDGIDIYHLPGDRQADYRNSYLGFVFQQHHLLPHLTVQENVLLSAAMNNPDGSALEAAMAALDRVGLSDKAHRLPGELSGGEQARVAIARCLMRNPPIILADEPTGNLDSKTGHQILTLLEQLNQQGHTVVIVTHSEEAAKFARRVVRLSDGRVLSDKPDRRHGFAEPHPDSGESPTESALSRARKAFANGRRTTRRFISYVVAVALTLQAVLILYLIWQSLTGPLEH